MRKFGRNNYWFYGLIILVGFLLYFKSLFFDFVYFDDNELILSNLSYLSDPHNIWDAFNKDVFYTLHSVAAYYRPLLTVSFITDVWLGGTGPFIFHLTNLILHLIVTSLVFWLLQKLGVAKKIALFLTFLFLVHPVSTQAVSWIPGRNDPLLAIFTLASFIFFLNFVREKKAGSYLLSLIFFLLALFTKETVLVLPVICLLYLWQNKMMKQNLLISLTVGWFLSLAIWWPMRHAALQNPLTITFKEMIMAIFSNSPATIQMLGKVFFPFNLSVLPNILDTSFLWGILALIILAFLYFWRGEQEQGQVAYGQEQGQVATCPYATCPYHIDRTGDRSLMLLGIVWFLAFLLPSFIRPDSLIMADFLEHRLYLSLIGFLIFLSQSRLFMLSSRIGKKLFWLVGSGLIILFSFITFYHQDNFADKFAFWQNAAVNSPHSPLAQKNLGAMYHLDKQYQKAEEYYKKASTLNDLEPMVHSNLGLIYANRGDFVSAEQEYLKEISFNPNYDDVHFNLGLLYYNTKKFDEAKQEWEKTLAINPEYPGAKEAIRAIPK